MNDAQVEQGAFQFRCVVVQAAPRVSTYSAYSEWLLAMKQALGCGGMLEGEALVLQGDQRSRVRAWLQARGVSRISVG